MARLFLTCIVLLVSALPAAARQDRTGPTREGVRVPAPTRSTPPGHLGNDPLFGTATWISGGANDPVDHLPLGYHLFVYPYTHPVSGAYLGIERYLVYVPDVPPLEPRPLLVGFHGYSRSEFELVFDTTFSQEAEARGWYMLFPLGRYDALLDQQTYSHPQSQAVVAEDLRRVCQQFPIDTDRIYGAGFSMGGGAVTNFAARHLDPEQPMLAAVINHTGTVAVADTYQSIPDDAIDPPFEAPDFLRYMFGTPAQNPFGYAQASTIEWDGVAVDPDTDLARNLTHVPIQVWYNVNDSGLNAYIKEQTEAFVDHFFGELGGSGTTRAINGPNPPQSHLWSIVNETLACDFLETKSLALPDSASTLVDRDGTFFWFDVEQLAAGAFSPFTWDVNTALRRLVLVQVENVERIAFDTVAAGLDPQRLLRVDLQVLDANPLHLVLEDYAAAPYRVLLDGQELAELACDQAGGWCHDPLADTLTVSLPEPFDALGHVLEVVPLPPDLDRATVVADLVEVVADDVEVATLTVTVLDTLGRVVPGEPVDLFSDGSATIVDLQPVTDSTGKARFEARSTVAQAEVFTASLGGQPVPDTATVTFLADPDSISASLSGAVLGSGTIEAGDATSLTVTVVDAYGNPVPDQVVEFSVLSGADVSLVQPAGPTDALGQAVGSVSSTLAEAKLLAVTVNPAGTPVVLDTQPGLLVEADRDNLSPSLSSLAVVTPGGGTVVADAVEVATLSATITDVYGNPVSAVEVQFTASGSDNSGLATPVVTDGSGLAQAFLSSTRAETKVLGAVADPAGAAVALVDQPAVDFVADFDGVSASLSSVAVSGGDVVADGVQVATVTVTVVDTYGNPIAGHQVELAASGTDNSLTQPGVLTDAGGVAVGSLASTRAEVKTVTALVDPLGGAFALADAPTATFVGDPANLSASLSSLTVDLASIEAGDSTGVTVRVRDANDNPVANVAVDLAATGTDNVLTPASGTTDGAGELLASFGSTRAEPKTLSALLDPGGGAVALDDTPQVDVLADFDGVDASLSSVAVSGGDVVADGVQVATVTVTVVDTYGNPIAGHQVELAASGTDNSLTQPGAQTDASGVAVGSLASTRAEVKTVTALVDPLGGAFALADAPTATFVGDPATIDAGLSSLVLSDTFGLRADGSESTLVTVTVRDANANPVPGQTVAFEASGLGNSLGVPSATSDAAGAASTTLTSTVAETKTVGAVVNPGPGEVVLGSAPAVTFVWPEPATYYVRAGGSDAAPGTSPATAWASLTHAATQVAAGDTVHVGAGLYAGPVTLTVAGTGAAPVRWLADVSGQETGDAGEVVVDGGGAAATIVLAGASHNHIAGFTLVGANPGVGSGAAVHLPPGGTTGVELRGIVVHSSDRGVHAEGATDLDLVGCRISGLGGVGEGVRVDGGSSVRVLDGLVYACAGPGVHVTGGASGVSVRGTTLYQNAGDALLATDAGTQVSVLDSILSDGLADGLEAAAGAVVTTQHTLVFGHAGSAYVGLSADPTDLAVDPLLVDPAGPDLLLGGPDWADDDFRLQVTSPALDAGSEDAVAVELGDGSVLADRTARADDVLDGTAPDGATLDLGRHAAAPVDGLEVLAAGDARIVLGEADNRQLVSRRQIAAGGGLGAEQRVLPVGVDPVWVQVLTSPLALDEEFLAVVTDQGATPTLSLLEWGGAQWARAFAEPLPGGIERRTFDLEHTWTGDLLLVHSDGSARPVARRRVAGVWLDAEPLPLNDGAGPGPDLSTGTVEWVRISARPGSEELVLAFSDSTGALVALPHDGTQWDTSRAVLLASDLTPLPSSGTIDTRPFDLAHGASGDLVVAWSRVGLTGLTWSSLPAGGSWSTSQTLSGLASSAAPQFVALAPEPGGDRIALGTMNLEGTEVLGLATWDGTAWVDAVDLDPQARDWNGAAAGNAPLAVGWSGSEALCVYADQAASALDFATWSSGVGWSAGTPVTLSGKGLSQSVVLASRSGEALAVFSDDALDLRAALFDGSVWTVLAGGAPLGASLGSAAVPFDVDLR